MGCGTWNSRGIDAALAVRAMLGDVGAFVETPLFTLYRLQLRHGAAGGRRHLRAALFPSLFGEYGWFSGLEAFVRRSRVRDAVHEARHRLCATEEELSRLRRRSDASADSASSIVAQLLIDDHVERAYVSASALGAFDEPDDDRGDVLYTSAYVVTAASW